MRPIRWWGLHNDAAYTIMWLTLWCGLIWWCGLYGGAAKTMLRLTQCSLYNEWAYTMMRLVWWCGLHDAAYIMIWLIHFGATYTVVQGTHWHQNLTLPILVDCGLYTKDYGIHGLTLTVISIVACPPGSNWSYRPISSNCPVIYSQINIQGCLPEECHPGLW